MVLPGHEVIASVSQVAASALAAALWQGVLLAGAAALGLRLLPETPAPVRFSIWFGVFLLVATLPFATVLMAPARPAAAAAMPHHAWLMLDARWCIWVGAFWAGASLVRAITLAAAAFRVRALWKRAEPVELFGFSGGCSGKGNTEVLRFHSSQQPGRGPQLYAQDDNSKTAQDDNSKISGGGTPWNGMARGAKVCVSDEVDRPTVIGFFAPKIVIPRWLVGKLTPEELRQVVLHEAGHLSRRDDWLNLLQKLALVVFPLNPALAWVERRLCFERELACDEHVLAATGAPKAYAECLATLAEYRLQRRGLLQGLALALGAIGRESELTRRVLRILSGGTRMKKNHARLVFGGSMLALVFAASAMERSPQLVGFANPGTGNREQGTEVSAAQPTTTTADFHALAVRASVAPAEQWKTVGDAMPHVTRRAVAPGRTSAYEMATEDRAMVAGANRFRSESVTVQARNTEVLRSVQDDNLEVAGGGNANALAPEVIQTVAMTRQVTADGRVLVTRMVTLRAYNVSNRDASQAVADVQEPAYQPTQKLQQVVHGYAAVPVQGGWLVIQL